VTFSYECYAIYQGKRHRVASVDFNNGRVNLNAADIVPIEECQMTFISIVKDSEIK